MANIKSQKKRALTNEKKRLAAQSSKSELKTAIKNVLVAVENKDAAKAQEAFNIASKKLDKAVVAHTKHANYAARQKSRLAKAVNSINA